MLAILLEGLARHRNTSASLERSSELEHVTLGFTQTRLRLEPSESSGSRQRYPQRHRSSAIDDLNCLTRLDHAQVDARILPELSQPYFGHVIHVAHRGLAGNVPCFAHNVATNAMSCSCSKYRSRSCPRVSPRGYLSRPRLLGCDSGCTRFRYRAGPSRSRTPKAFFEGCAALVEGGPAIDPLPVSLAAAGADAVATSGVLTSTRPAKSTRPANESTPITSRTEWDTSQSNTLPVARAEVLKQEQVMSTTWSRRAMLSESAAWLVATCGASLGQVGLRRAGKKAS